MEYSAYEVHQSAQEFQKAYESKKSFERTETDEAEADGEKKAEEQSGDRPYGVLESGSEYEVDTYLDNRDNSNRLYIYDEAKEVMDQMLDRLLFDVPEEYHIDRDHFYTYLDDYYENNI